eukprot:2150296-Karenia_brevis.AAC.1
MHKVRLALNMSSFNTPISACEKGGQLWCVAPLLNEMRSKSLLPKMIHSLISFSAAISACGNGWQWRLVVPLLDEMHN